MLKRIRLSFCMQIVLVGLLFLCPGMSSSDVSFEESLEIVEFTVLPEDPRAGVEVTISVKTTDSQGVRGVRIEGGRLRKEQACDGEKECIAEFKITIPAHLSGLITLTATAKSVSGSTVSVTKDIDILDAGEVEDKDAKASPGDLKNPLGVAVSSRYKGERFLRIIKELGVKRTFINISWDQIEPRQGSYRWDVLDAFIEQLPGDAEALLRIRSKSKWATGTGTVPGDMEQYYQLVYNTVKHAKGRIKYFENDWEADIKKHWSGTAGEYVEALKTFYRAVKAADPEAIVIAGGHSGAFPNGSPAKEKFFKHLFREGADYFDLFDLHLYGKVYDIPYRVKRFRKLMAQFGINKGIVATEFGGPTPLEFPRSEWIEIEKAGKKDITIFTTGLKGYPEKYRLFAMDIPEELEHKRDRIQAREMTQRTMLGLSSGVRMMFWWKLFGNQGQVKGHRVIHPVFGKLSLLAPGSQTFKPSARPFQFLVSQLSDVKQVSRKATDKKDIFLFELEKKDGSKKYVLWQEREIIHGEDLPPVSFSLKTGWSTVYLSDVLGNSRFIASKDGTCTIQLTDTPVFLERRGNDNL